MFATRPEFKNAFQLEASRVIWRAVEVLAQWPWFIATVSLDEEGGARQSFILSTDKDVSAFLEAPMAPGQFTGLTIISPPNQSPTRQWVASSVISIERPTNPGLVPATRLTFLCQDGNRYGGFPLEAMNLHPNEVEVVLRFTKEDSSPP